MDPNNIQLHVTESWTGPVGSIETKNPHDAEKSTSKGVAKYHGRPDVIRHVREFGRDAVAHSRVAVIGRVCLFSLTLTISVCGPASLVREVSAGCREVQWSIAKGSYELSEMWLHREAFSW